MYNSCIFKRQFFSLFKCLLETTTAVYFCRKLQINVLGYFKEGTQHRYSIRYHNQQDKERKCYPETGGVRQSWSVRNSAAMLSLAEYRRWWDHGASWFVRNSVASLSLAAYYRWWGQKARKWFYNKIQGEEEADGHDWSGGLLLRSHWLNIAGGGITRPGSGTTTAYKERRRRTVTQVFYVP